MDELTKGTAVLAAICWLFALVAAVDLWLGNPSAVNGVIGGGIPALAITAAAVQLHRTR